MKEQPRILFYVPDGTGLGHLRRISRVARALQGAAACLVVCGYRDAAWIVSPECEYMHIPSLDSLVATRAQYWNRSPFWDLPISKARQFRREIIDATVKAFNPHAIVVDHLPAGSNEELLDVIRRSSAHKFLIVRGVDCPEHARADLLSGPARVLIDRFYSAILVASDSRICDISTEFGIERHINEKIQYVGYISSPVSTDIIKMVRQQREILPGHKWIVCSGGGGALGEHLIDECIRLSTVFTDATFDIVVGPRSASQTFADTTTGGQSQRVRIHRNSPNLPLWHAAANIVTCPGGYNSLVEALEGFADIICIPTQTKTNDEQVIHTSRLSQFCPIETVTDLPKFEGVLRKAIMSNQINLKSRGRGVLNFDGATVSANAILSFLNKV